MNFTAHQSKLIDDVVAHVPHDQTRTSDFK